MNGAQERKTNSSCRGRKIVAAFVVGMLLCMLLPLNAFAVSSPKWSAFRGNVMTNNAAVSTDTASTTNEANLRWACKYAEQGASFVKASDPVLYEGYLYLVVESIGADWMTLIGCTLLKIDANEGTVVNRKEIQMGETGTACIEYVCRPVIVDDYLYVPFTGAQLQGFSLNDLTPKWGTGLVGTPLKVDATDNRQIYTTLNASEDGTRLYMGTMTQGSEYGTTTSGSYICVDLSAGSVVWSRPDTSNGFYWSGVAFVPLSSTLATIVVIGDSGELLSLNAATGDVIDTSTSHTEWTLGMVRSSVVCDEDNSIYFSSHDGQLYKVSLKADGHFDNELNSVSFAAGSTSTPVICDGKAYVGGQTEDYKGCFCVINTATLEIEQTASLPASANGSAVVSVGNDNIARAYFTSNTTPGALYMLEQGSVATEATAIYTPNLADQNYCASSPIVDTNTGVIYYTNDSATLFAVANTWHQLAGASRYDTMAAISSESFSSASTVILATGENFPDALAASALAGANDCPLLLTGHDSLAEQAKNEIERLGASKVIIVGGEGVIGQGVVDELIAIPAIGNATSVDRYSGETRFGTALDIYQSGYDSWSSTAIVATGLNYPDALSIAPFAYYTNAPIFLAQGNGTLDAATRAAIVESGDFDRVIIVGASGVVKDETMADLEAALEGENNVIRLGGDDRYATSALIANYVTDSANWENPANVMSVDCCAVATGTNFPDALAGASLCGKTGSVLLLVDNTENGKLCVNEIIAQNWSAIERGYYLGGDGVVTPEIQELVRAARLVQ